MIRVNYPLEPEAAMAQLEAFTIAAERAQRTYHELLECRHAAALNAKRSGVSLGRIATVLGVSRQAVAESLRRISDAE